MRVTIDLDALLREGKISQAEYDKFSQFAAVSTASLAFNILVGFGVIAVSGGAIALLPTPVTSIAIGLVVCAAGIGLRYAHYVQWMLLANICVLVGALLFGAGIITAGDGSVASFLVVAAAFTGAGIFARSSLLVVLAVLALSSCLGAKTGYLHATYFLGIEEPSLTVVLFTLFSIGAYQLSKRLAADYQRMAIAASRTGVFLVNFGFWIGSLWGDRKWGGAIVIPDWVFASLWAIALIGAGVWAWKRNRRWLVNVVAVFAAIHLYTQWFERLGASPETVLIAGLVALGFAVGLRAVNARLGTG
jgi:iron complex transport system permease protein